MPHENQDSQAIIKAPKPKLMPIIEKTRSALEEFLPTHIDHEKFFRVANGVLKGNDYLMKCLDQPKGKVGFLNSMKQAAIDGLIPDGKYEAAIVPFKGVPTYVRMYGGMVKMMRQSGDIIDVQTGLVYQSEFEDPKLFDFARGTEPFLHHKEMLIGDRGPMVACWAIIRTKGGGFYFEVMGKEDVMKIKSGSPAKANGPWANKAHEGAMWRKTVLRQAAKLAPLSTDLHNAFNKEDEQSDFSHLQAPTAAQRLENNMNQKAEGESTPLLGMDEPRQDQRQDRPKKEERPIEDAVVTEDVKQESTTISVLNLPEPPDEMTSKQWSEFTDALLEQYKKADISAADFDKANSYSLGAMAQKSTENYNRMIDALEDNG